MNTTRAKRDRFCRKMSEVRTGVFTQADFFYAGVTNFDASASHDTQWRPQKKVQAVTGVASKFSHRVICVKTACCFFVFQKCLTHVPANWSSHTGWMGPEFPTVSITQRCRSLHCTSCITIGRFSKRDCVRCSVSRRSRRRRV